MLTPADEAELSDAIRAATGPLAVRGGGTRPVGAPVSGEVLSTAGLSGIRLYEPGALTLVVRAGTPLAEVEAVLAAERQCLPFEPMDHRTLLGTEGEPTIGGVAATNASGPRRVQVGAARDFMLGVRFVDGAGHVVSSGGRVMKNVTGYDLVKLLAGSRATLGVLSEVSLKVLARPEEERTVILHGLDDAEAVSALCRAMGSPYDVGGAAHAPAGLLADEAQTLVRVEGTEASVRYRALALKDRLGGNISVVAGERSRALWAAVRDVVPFAGRDGAVWRVSVKPTDGPRLVAALGETVRAALYDWSGGLVWLLTDQGGDGGAREIRAQTARLGGHARLERAPEALRASVPVFEPEPQPVARLTAGLRAKFDPRGILNPGLMG